MGGFLGRIPWAIGPALVGGPVHFRIVTTDAGTTPPAGSDHPAADRLDSDHPAAGTAEPARTEPSVVVVAPKIRQPLNPAYAILFGALVTAGSGITAAVLSIRSSERLSSQQDKTSAAVQSNQDLQRKIDSLERALDAANAKLAGLTSSTVVTAAPPAPLPSILVILPTLDPAVTTAAPPTNVPTTAPATAPPVVPTTLKATATAVPAATSSTAAPVTVATTAPGAAVSGGSTPPTVPTATTTTTATTVTGAATPGGTPTSHP